VTRNPVKRTPPPKAAEAPGKSKVDVLPAPSKKADASTELTFAPAGVKIANNVHAPGSVQGAQQLLTPRTRSRGAAQRGADTENVPVPAHAQARVTPRTKKRLADATNTTPEQGELGASKRTPRGLARSASKQLRA
jgi:hypothetical protein